MNFNDFWAYLILTVIISVLIYLFVSGLLNLFFRLTKYD
jgi:hypothetical protein